MAPQKTHREVKAPQISARYLADFMAGSERGRRSVVQKCKYQAIARVVQHEEAKSAVSRFFRHGEDVASLLARAQALRDRMADDDFERDVLDHNADYIDRVAHVYDDMEPLPPAAEVLAPGPRQSIFLGGVKISTDIQFRLRRLTKTNKVRIGAATFRYAKGKPLSRNVGEWQAAFMLGFLARVPPEEGAEPERGLCLTLDAYAGVWHAAPSDSLRRFHNMEAACLTIAEWWPAIAPPANAVI